jgi:DNA ligase-1
MHNLSAVAEAIAGSTRKNEKIRLLAEYFRARTLEEAAIAAVFLSGRPFPAWEETTLQAGSGLLVRVLLEVSGKTEAALERAYRHHGDLGAAAGELLARGITWPPEKAARQASQYRMTVNQVAHTLRQIASTHGAAPKAALLRQLLERATPLEAKYIIKIITGELRIGLKESLVEEAIARAYGTPLKEVQRANMLLGDLGETLRLAAAGQLGAARMRLFHPIGFMLASPAESPQEALAGVQPAQIEDKYDGIRAQAHCGSPPDAATRGSAHNVRLFSRTLDEVTESFPELVAPLSLFRGVILDGEILAWDFNNGRALGFSELQKRLGRKKVTASVMRTTPVAYVVFDVLYANGELVIDRPLRERRALLEKLFAEADAARPVAAHRGHLPVHDLQGKLAFEPAVLEEEASSGLKSTGVLLAPALRADSSADLEELFVQAQAHGNEGLMVKDTESSYTPGRRGRCWIKLKRELATLDVVVTSVEWGHGKRIGVLSDYTFAVKDGERLVNLGKAYSGLTDREIAGMTQWFLDHTVADHGFWREVEPKIVIEVAFNAIMRSDRHNSGYALRFPRVLRLRPDKPPEEVDTLERVREIYDRQRLPRSA